jgi:hypothetical protein
MKVLSGVKGGWIASFKHISLLIPQAQNSFLPVVL